MSERWRPVPGFPDYEVSDQGRVRSWKVWRGDSGPRLLKPNTDYWGYEQVCLYRGREQKSPSVHVLVLAAFVGPMPEWASQIRHMDGDQTNNALANLRYGSGSENILDSVRHGTHYMGNKTHCKRNHEFTPENTRIETTRDGYAARRCLTCERNRNRQRAAGRRSMVLQT